jgi:DNA-directed RNA polymerase specialized sigma24 family protein
MEVPAVTTQEYATAYESGYFRTVRMLRSRGASTERAEDGAQSAWLQGWKKLDQLRDQSLIVGWVNTIALNYYRRTAGLEGRYQPLSPSELYRSTSIDTASIDVFKILDNCRPGDRPLFESQLVGLTAKEIARERGGSATAVRIRLHRARLAARSLLGAKTLTAQRAYSERTAAA